MSGLRRLARFVYSRRNIGGSLLAVVGLALFFAGITPGVVGLGVIAAMYVIGYLLVPPERGISLQLGQAQDASQVQSGLDTLLNGIRGRVPDDIFARVESIRESILATLPQGADDSFSAADPNVNLIRQTALAYLPEALSSYLAIPRAYAEARPVADGRTPHAVLLDQLNLMDSKMQEVADDVARHDSDKLLANGRFLAERFATSTLQVAPTVVAASPAAAAQPVEQSVQGAEAERERVR